MIDEENFPTIFKKDNNKKIDNLVLDLSRQIDAN
jgi:hypothetical protein